MNIASQARHYREQGKYILALACAQAGSTISCLAEQARALNWLGKSKESLQTALQAAQSCNSETAVATIIDAKLSLCSSYISSGKYEDALREAQKVENLHPSVPPLETEQIAHIYIALAASHSCIGNKKHAIKHAQKAIVLLKTGRERVLAEAFHALADSFHRGAYFSDAAQAWQQALALRRANLHHQHPEIATNVDGLALSLRRLQQPQLALTLHQEALRIYQHSFATNHPAIAACYHGIAQCCHRLSQFEAARSNLNAALQISESLLGSDHPDTWISRFELGRIEVDCGELAQGIQRMEFARMRLAHLLGEKHPTILAMDKWRTLAKTKG